MVQVQAQAWVSIAPVADLNPEKDFNTTKTISTKKKKKKNQKAEERMKSFKQIRIPEAKSSKYIVKQNPSNKLWYALGSCWTQSMDACV